jgi:hypothetical protein
MIILLPSNMAPMGISPFPAWRKTETESMVTTNKVAEASPA